MSQTTGYKYWGYLLLLASLICIFVATLNPLNFFLTPNFTLDSIADRFNRSSDVKDYWQNILLFIPLGVSLSLIFGSSRHFFRPIIICLLFSAAVSSLVEVTQLFLPTRVSNLADIISNSLGGIVGGILFYWRSSILKFIAGILTHNQALLSLKSLLIAIATYCSLVALAIVVLLVNVNLSNWNDSYHLAIGNEVTGDRPWQGYINSLHICDRAFVSSQVSQIFDLDDFACVPASELITSFDFSDLQQFYPDRSNNIGDLRWYKNPAFTSINWQQVSNISSSLSVQDFPIYQYLGVLLDQQWLKTTTPAVKLNRKLKKTGEFSILLTVAAQSPDQKGPARIIALADGIYAQNTIVAQSKKDLIFRLRTPVTGSNANQPDFLVPDVFDSNGFHKILITFAAKQLNIYIDSEKNRYSFTFSIYHSFLSYLPWNINNWTINLADFNFLKYKILFYTVILLPLIVLGYYLLSLSK